MPLTKEQLLIPRVLCIGGKDGEPNDTSGRYITGQIIEIKRDRDWFIDCDSEMKYSDFPHLFKPLHWCEMREASDLPEYVKFVDESTGNIDFVLKVEKYMLRKDTYIVWAFEYKWENEPDLKRMALSGWQPADLTDYMEYQKQKEA